MAHTDNDPPSQPQGIIQQRPPPPPGYKAPDDNQTVDPAAPTDPQAPAPSAPQEAPQQQPGAARVAGAYGNGPRSAPGRKIQRKASTPHMLPPPDLAPEIINRAIARAQADSAPNLMLLSFPRQHTVRPTRPDVIYNPK